MSLLPNLDQMTDNEKLAVLESIQKSIAESKEIQKKKIGENVDLVVQALKKIESDIRDRFDAVGNSIEKRVLSIQDGRDGTNGKDGRDGKDGKSGRDGAKGDRGVDGQAGRDGVDGVDGISVVNAQIDFDGSLVITLSDGRELNVGEVVSADIAEKIKVINTMSTNGAVGIKDEGTSISTGVKTINFVGATVTATNSGDDVTVNVSAGTGTVTSVAATVPAFLSITGSPVTTTGTLAISLSGTALPVANGGTGQTSYTDGQLLIGNTTGNTLTKTTLTAGSGISITNGGGSISIAATGSGTVTSVTGTSPVVSSGGATPAISLAASYGDTQNPYASKTANYVLAAPNGSAGVPTFRAIVAADIPTLNQSTTGSAATLTTPRAIYGNNFDGSAALTQIIASTYGGTGNGFTKFTGATTAERTYTLPDASSIIVVQGGALGTPSSGTVTNLTGTASININGTVGATTPAAGAFTSVTASTTLGVTGTTTLTGVATLTANPVLSAGTANGVTYLNGSKSLTSGSAITFDGTNFATTGTATATKLIPTGTSVTGNGLYLPAANALGLSTNGTNAVYIDSSQNVGIGTSSPSGKLNVISGSVAQLIIGFSGTSASYLDSDSIVFRNAATTERMRIDTSGNLLVNATSQIAQGKFGVAFVGSTNQAASFNETSGAGSWTTVLFQRLGTTIGSISNATSSTAYNTSSDYRLKNTIAPMTGALAKVQALKPVTYKWNIDDEVGEGFIAHELAEVCPHAVTGKKDAVDADGNPVYQGIDVSFLVATLTAAIQEQQALITALTARITALENK